MAEPAKTWGAWNVLLRDTLRHVWAVLKRKEALAAAMTALRTDFRKARHAAPRLTEHGRNHQKAAKLTESGRRYYNKSSYTAAERFFRNASAVDPQYALPVAYLGNALYKQGKYEEAVFAWSHAYALDPDSEGGKRAQEKLRMMQAQQTGVVRELEERVRHAKSLFPRD